MAAPSIDSSFQGVYRYFVLSFEDKAQRTSTKRSYLPTLEIKDYNIMISGQNFFDQPVKNDLRTYGSIQKIAMITELAGCWTIII